MNGYRTGNTKVTSGISGQRGSGRFNSLRRNSGQLYAVGCNLTIGNSGIVGMIGDRHIHSHTGREGLGIGGSRAAGIRGELTDNGNGCLVGVFVISFQYLAFGKLRVQGILVHAIVVQTQYLSLLSIVHKAEGYLQRVGHQTIASVRCYGYINGFTHINGGSHRDHAADGISHIQFGIDRGRSSAGAGSCTCTSAGCGGCGSESGLCGCLRADPVIL